MSPRAPRCTRAPGGGRGPAWLSSELCQSRIELSNKAGPQCKQADDYSPIRTRRHLPADLAEALRRALAATEVPPNRP